MRGITVGQLRAMLDGIDPQTFVVMDDGEGWYVNVGGVTLPNDDGYVAVTLERGEAWDVRQGGYGWDEVTA